MPLPWVRIDTNIGQNDKILRLIHDQNAPPARRWQAAFAYVSAIGWSAGGETDGVIPAYALPLVNANTAVAALLVEHRLWEPNGDGWLIHNYDVRQQLSVVAQEKRRLAQESGQRAACARWHGPDCWTDKGCSREA